MTILLDTAEVQVIETVTANGRTVEVQWKPGSPGANRDSLHDRAAQALQINATYLALVSPTNAQIVAQQRALTKECNALIRLLLSSLSDISDT